MPAAVKGGETAFSACKLASMLEAARAISWVFCDVDGVLTDGSLAYLDQGESGKIFNAQDGAMIKQACRLGLKLGILSGRDSPALKLRAAELGFECCLSGVADKAAAISRWSEEEHVELSEIAYLADDIPDLAIIALVGWSAAVADASPLLRHRCDFIAQRNGGRGAVAEILFWLLRLQQRWPDGDNYALGHG